MSKPPCRECWDPVDRADEGLGQHHDHDNRRRLFPQGRAGTDHFWLWTDGAHGGTVAEQG